MNVRVCAGNISQDADAGTYANVTNMLSAIKPSSQTPQLLAVKKQDQASFDAYNEPDGSKIKRSKSPKSPPPTASKPKYAYIIH